MLVVIGIIALINQYIKPPHKDNQQVILNSNYNEVALSELVLPAIIKRVDNIAYHLPVARYF